MTDLHDKARCLVALRTEMPSYWHRDPHEVSAEMADIIAELLAENERLEGIVETQRKTTMEAIIRTNTAERRYEALCEAEPVARIYEWTDPDDGGDRQRLLWGSDAIDSWVPASAKPKPLIPRPSMESNNG